MLFVVFATSLLVQTKATVYIYDMDPTNKYSLSASIQAILESGRYDDNDITKFYFILKEVEEGTIPTARDLLRKYNVDYEISVIPKSVIPAVSWKYLTSISPYYAGFSKSEENKKLVATFVDLELRYFTSGSVVTMGINQCPYGWVNISQTGFTSSCAKIRTGFSYYAGLNSKTIESRYFTRLFDSNVDQSIYGYDSSYQPKFTFSYQRKASSSEVRMTLIDHDKLIVERIVAGSIEDTFYITKDFHYSRNQFQVVFPGLESEFRSELFAEYECDSKSAYFHQLAIFNGDTSNLRNKKFVCKAESSFVITEILESFPLAASEVVYTGAGSRVTQHTNFGTFNFSVDTEEHYMMDVYPYLLWGNSPYDSTTLKERLIWDYDSRRINLFDNLRKWRGDILFSRYSARIHPSLAVEGFKNANAVYELLNNRLSWKIGGAMLLTYENPVGCSGLDQLPCRDYFPY
jgi:hypothetical protein